MTAEKTFWGQKNEAKPFYVDQRFWRAMVTDVCQLPNFPRPNGNPAEYLECVPVPGSERYVVQFKTFTQTSN